MKDKINWVILMVLFIPSLAFAQKLDDFNVFLKSFKDENKKDTIMMLGNLKPPGEFGCGTGAMEYFNQIEIYSNGKGKSINNLNLLQEFEKKMDNPIFWDYLYGSIYTRDKHNNEIEVSFKNDEARNSFFKNAKRLGINFEKIDRKNIAYHCIIGDLKENKQVIESYYLIKVKKQWKLDKITTITIENNFEGVYPNF
ncbi:hypothetical protein J2X31_003653 [Flavobacterium arsenatis]|uniref:Uncharacterized protein n=1 Tax=Flavobacterium arsenatis TaxID=1484332 RepID=A0ABU1TUR3_9FLAO|nr:hypothetical protein [Flavobacterium arsenatis]MDR6969620.1 hypothetical protein [Flavobacterium arsenatis]